jgi:hypothetical protein
MEASFLKKLNEIERRRGWAWSGMDKSIRQSKKNIKSMVIRLGRFANWDM